MSPEQLRSLLERVRAGELDVAQALERLRQLPYRDVGVASVDHHRALRLGVPEVVYGESKTAEQIVTIVDELVRGGHNVLVTRLSGEKAAVLAAAHPAIRYLPEARVARLDVAPVTPRSSAPVAVVCAGTSDIGVAEEAAETLAALGIDCLRIYDVGVAGIHRLLGRSKDLESASAAIVIAGMEGALPSVVGGLIGCPIIAVPTSVGYGTALGGFTALMSMLTSCASGVTVVNIDNGFGAAMAVHRLLPRVQERHGEEEEKT
ncbi:MAG TPA: nickel pincer cofactor biosynthesis protein LarB [Polyangiaceae bacterium]|jgi:pyridinium-3,5-biscarboxylic acid mononucleotide synthase|nr:nickel pincer cofactor biosynthesis protein LarB [Polyangiaceae bacterium]